MSRRRSLFLIPVVMTLVVAVIAVVASTAEYPRNYAIQRGARGTGMAYIYNPRIVDNLRAANDIPVSLPYVGEVGPKAASYYKNVQVLGDLSEGEFARLMVNMTTWLAPKQGCSTCHNLQNLADDSLYTKRVARRMLQMTRHINADWTTHVAQTGVTCYTCHRGRLVPANIWFENPGPVQAGGMAQMPAGKNHPTGVAGGSALPADPFTPFLEGDANVRVNSTDALPSDNHQSIKQAEWTYALMINMSLSLGVNCDYCHNTRSFADWAGSPPTRATAWYGIRMVRELNAEYLKPLLGTLPENRLGQLGDAPKVYCATCHNGVYKPLFGVSMLKNFPELRGGAPRAREAASGPVVQEVVR